MWLKHTYITAIVNQWWTGNVRLEVEHARLFCVCVCVYQRQANIDIHSIASNALRLNNSWLIHVTSFSLTLTVSMTVSPTTPTPCYSLRVNSKERWIARSQTISQLSGPTLAQLSQHFHYSLSYCGDNCIISAPSSPTAPLLSLLRSFSGKLMSVLSRNGVHRHFEFQSKR